MAAGWGYWNHIEAELGQTLPGDQRKQQVPVIIHIEHAGNQHGAGHRLHLAPYTPQGRVEDREEAAAGNGMLDDQVIGATLLRVKAGIGQRFQ